MTGSEVSLILLLCLIAIVGSPAQAGVLEHTFNVRNFTVNKLCQQSVITGVNQQFPGPAIHVSEGDILAVRVHNKSPYNITIHWHGIFQQLSAWADGTNYITQCPITPGSSYTYRFNIIGQEGTLWWHAHNSVLRATVYGALIIHPRTPYPFPTPYEEVPILLGEWYKSNVVDLEKQAFAKARAFTISDALTINGKPGDLFKCSDNSTNTFKMEVKQGKTYLLRIINAAMNSRLFFKVAGHNLTVVAADASYTVPYTTDVLVLGPGQTLDALLVADANPGSYYMASQAFSSAYNTPFINTTATGIVKYKSTSATPLMPTMLAEIPTFSPGGSDFPPASEMKVIAAYLLALLGGNSNPSSKDIKHILGSVGADAEDERIEFLLAEVKGKDITELIASGREKFASVPSGGGGAVAVSAGGGGAAAAPAAAAAEPKKEEKVEEKEESDDDMGFSLFD